MGQDQTNFRYGKLERIPSRYNLQYLIYNGGGGGVLAWDTHKIFRGEGLNSHPKTCTACTNECKRLVETSF